MRRAVAAVAAAAVIVAAACQPPPPPSIAIDPNAPHLRVMVVGDSFALSVGLGLDHYGASSGTMTVLNASLVGCGFGRGGRNRGIGLDREWPDECRNNEARLQMLAAAWHPDVVLCAGGLWDITDRKLAGATVWTHVGIPSYDWYLALEFQHLTRVLSQTGAQVVWTTAPTWNPRYDPALFMGPPPYAEAKPGRSDRYNAVLYAAVGGQRNAHIVDLASWMRGFGGGEFSPGLRVDGVHLTPQSTDVVASQFLGPWAVFIGRTLPKTGDIP